MELNETEPQFCSRQTEPDLRCYYHPEREATNQCDRCGDYLCGECVQSLRREQLCPTCYNWCDPDETLLKWGKAILGAARPVVSALFFVFCLAAWFWILLWILTWS